MAVNPARARPSTTILDRGANPYNYDTTAAAVQDIGLGADWLSQCSIP